MAQEGTAAIREAPAAAPAGPVRRGSLSGKVGLALALVPWGFMVASMVLKPG
jgi:hypothetical protein